MLSSRDFWFGVVATVLVTYGYHHFVGAIPGGKKAS
jgi:hypothetical protein